MQRPFRQIPSMLFGEVRMPSPVDAHWEKMM